jgi:Ca2+-dependent lipid-binding protein
MARLEVTVVEATNLKQKDKVKENDSFIRIYFHNQKRKTTTIKKSNNPAWNEAFVLYVTFSYFLFYSFWFNSVII